MRPPACVACRWGTGTTCSVKQSNTAAVREMEKKLAEMQAERKKQEQQWIAPVQENGTAKK